MGEVLLAPGVLGGLFAADQLWGTGFAVALFLCDKVARLLPADA